VWGGGGGFYGGGGLSRVYRWGKRAQGGVIKERELLRRGGRIMNEVQWKNAIVYSWDKTKGRGRERTKNEKIALP